MTEPRGVDRRGLRSAVQLAPLQVPKASDVLAADLRERILRGEIEIGSSLPAERELVAQTRLSRSTVREALRILQQQGLVVIRGGRFGGAFASSPDKESVASSVELLIRGQQIRIASLLDTRAAIEPNCALLAAQYRTDADLEVLDRADEAIKEPGSLSDFLEANVDWHVGVAIASHNEILAGFMLALSRAIYAATDNGGFVDDDIRAATVTAHRSITSAIRDRDGEAAIRRMTGHVHAYAKAVLEVEQRTSIDLPES